MELLERDGFLDRMRVRLEGARAGRGGTLLVAGEAGIGKSALVSAFLASVQGAADSYLGACDALSTPRPLGPLLDVAPTLSPDLDEALRRADGRETVFRILLGAVSERDRPVVLVFEDVHWADEATLDVLRFLARRAAALPLLVIATYRDDEVAPDHLLTLVLGDLATTAAVERITLQGLSEAAVRTLAAGAAVDVAELRRRTAGNPFLVTEILAQGAEGVPDTVRDVVLARAARLPAAARAGLDAAAVIGYRVEPWLLEGALEGGLGPVDAVTAAGLLVPDGPNLRFRHELSRQALLEALPPWTRTALHRRVLARLRASPADSGPDALARLAHHADEAGDAAAVLAFAPGAARRAAELRAHREAAAQYARALRFAEGLAVAPRAGLLEALAYERYLTGDIEGATTARRQALALRRTQGDGAREGENLRWLSRLAWFAGDAIGARERAAEAITVLEALEPGSQLAWAYSNRSQLCMLDRDVLGAVTWGERAEALAERFGDAEIRIHAHNNMGAALLMTGDPEGQRLLEASLREARELDLEEHVARAHTNLASHAVGQRRLEEAEAYLAEGLAYTREVDLDAWRLYMLGWHAQALLHRGRWGEAARIAEHTLAHARLPSVSRVQPLVVLGLVRARTGSADPFDPLDRAADLALRTEELQRIGPVACGRAEAAWLSGGADLGAEEPLIRRAFALAERARDPWLGSELARWMHLLDGETAPPPWARLPFVLQMRGHWRQAAAAWDALGCVYDGAVARLEGDDEAALHRAYADLAGLGAHPLLPRVEARLRHLGLRGPPRGPRPSTRANPAQLTRRQLDVLALMAEGLSNTDIAARLVRSPKTVDHHVSAVLAKLDAQNRTEAVRRALDAGMLGTRESG